MKLPANYSAFGHALRRYWQAYGGLKALLASPLCHLSILVAGLSYNKWLHGDWTDTALSLLPNLLGFSLGSYALIFSLGSVNVMNALAKAKTASGGNRLEEINSTFVHFVMVQALGLLLALVDRSTAAVDFISMLPLHHETFSMVTKLVVYPPAFIGYWLMTYSVVLLISAVLAVFRLALISGRVAEAEGTHHP